MNIDEGQGNIPSYYEIKKDLARSNFYCYMLNSIIHEKLSENDIDIFNEIENEITKCMYDYDKEHE